MGTFLGHILPGVFFMLTGLVGLNRTVDKYLQLKGEYTNDQAASSFNEAIFKLIVCIGGILTTFIGISFYVDKSSEIYSFMVKRISNEMAPNPIIFLNDL
jgi:uncharacterized membrane protein